jgi:hypothetical protein
MGLDIGVPPVGLVDRDDVGGIGGGERRVAFDDHEVVVVNARRLEAEIVRSRHHHRIGAERIEHDHLAVDVHAAAQHLRLPVVERILDVLRHHRVVSQALGRIVPAAEQRHGIGRRRGIDNGVFLRVGRRLRREVGNLLVDHAADVEARIVVRGALLMPVQDVLQQRPP